MTGWTDEARRASAEARRRSAHGQRQPTKRVNAYDASPNDALTKEAEQANIAGQRAAMRSPGSAAPRVTPQNIDQVITAQRQNLTQAQVDASNPKLAPSYRRNAKERIANSKRMIQRLEHLKTTIPVSTG